MKKKIIEGMRFGRLVIIKRIGLMNTSYYKPIVFCKCDCGKEVHKSLYDLNNGHTKSCGCLRDEGPKPKHGLRHIPEYYIWSHIIQRCENPNNSSYIRYGGRGIKVDSEWKYSFAKFYEDMGPRPFPNYSIERIDNNGNYTADNCEWIPMVKQALNRRNNRFIIFDGIKHTLGEWNKILNFPPGLLSQRINKLGWSVDKACSTPPKTPIKIHQASNTTPSG